MTTISQDITLLDKGIIVHQTNCLSVMGSGVALALKQAFPNLCPEYEAFCSINGSANLLGKTQTVKVGEELYVINLFGQFDFGGRRRNTRYGAWEKALPFVATEVQRLNLPIYFPYNVGCDRGGGDWRIISAMIEEYLPKATFCELPTR